MTMKKKRKKGDNAPKQNVIQNAKPDGDQKGERGGEA